jgi:hypothetical protein
MAAVLSSRDSPPGARLYVARLIANEEGAIEVDAPLRCGAAEQSGLRLAAVTALLRRVRAVVAGVCLDALLTQASFRAFDHGAGLGGRDKSATQTRLVAHHDEQKTPPAQPPQGHWDLRKEPNLTGVTWVADIFR